MSAASYLSAHGVEAAVAKAVASVCTRRPEDPIGDIGKQLIALSEKQAPPATLATLVASRMLDAPTRSKAL